MESGIFSSSIIGDLLAEQLEAAQRIIATNSAIMGQLAEGGTSLQNGSVDSYTSPQSLSPDLRSTPQVVRNLMQNNWQAETVSNAQAMDITGQWLLTDLKTSATSKFSWKHVPGMQTFSGKQLGIGSLTDGRIDGNRISWRVGNMRSTATIVHGNRLIGGEYFGAEGKLGDFVGEMQGGFERSPAEKIATARLSAEKGMSDVRVAVEQLFMGKALAHKAKVDFSGMYLITHGGAGEATILQDGNAITAKSSEGSWSGAVTGSTISIFGITGAMSNGVIAWTNGMVWTRQEQHSVCRDMQIAKPSLALPKSAVAVHLNDLEQPLLLPRESARSSGAPSPKNVRGTPRGRTNSARATPRGRTSSGDRRGAGTSLFPDPATLKKNLARTIYDVEKLYYETGICQAIARNPVFEQITFGVIILNSIWIGIATDYNKAPVLAEAPLWIQVVEQCFCCFFFFELMVRFLSFENKLDAGRDSWFLFDLFLVTMMVYETWLMTAFFLICGGGDHMRVRNVTILRIFRLSRITRLTRIARVARLLRQIPSLNILCKALSLAVSSVGATLVLLGVGIYIFSIFFVETLEGTPEGRNMFATVPMGMHTLLVDGVLAEHRGLINSVGSATWMHYIAILIYMFVVAMTMTDMLIGVISEIINSVAEVEKDSMLRDSVEAKMKNLLKEADTDHSSRISKSEFAEMLCKPEVVELLDELGVDTVSLVCCADLVFERDEDLGLAELGEILLGFRESASTVKDKLEVKKFMKEELQAGMHLLAQQRS